MFADCLNFFFPSCPLNLLCAHHLELHHLCRAAKTHWNSTFLFVLLIILASVWVAAIIDFAVQWTLNTHLS